MLVGEHHRLRRARARVLLTHGFGEHRLRYRKLIEQLVASGYECHAFDLRGHGESGGARGHVSRFADYLDDLVRFAATMDGEPPGARASATRPSVLFGHSLGGLISLSAVIGGIYPFAALVLSSPFLRPALAAPAVLRPIVRGLGRVFPRFGVRSPIQAESLTHDERIVAEYRDDPRIVRRLTLSWLGEVLRAQEHVFERAAEVKIPCLFAVAGADTVADPSQTRRVFQRLGSEEKHERVYAGFRHEVFNELERERAVADLLSWLDQRFESTRTPFGSRAAS